MKMIAEIVWSIFEVVELIILISEVTDKPLWQPQLTYLLDPFWFLSSPFANFLPVYDIG